MSAGGCVREAGAGLSGSSTIVGGAPDLTLAALWDHRSVKVALPREHRIALISEASRRVVEGWA